MNWSSVCCNFYIGMAGVERFGFTFTGFINIYRLDSYPKLTSPKPIFKLLPGSFLAVQHSAHKFTRLFLAK
jgi:hypothetical protein